MRVAKIARRSLDGRGASAVTRRGTLNFGLDRPWPRVGAFLVEDNRTSCDF